MAHDRKVAGIMCSEVLAGLSDYLDGALSEAQVSQVQAHLRGCDWCERFGSQMGTVVGQLRRQLGAAPPTDEEVSQRLLQRLELD